MIGILLITHNSLGDSLADCVRHVMGSVPPNIEIFPILADDDPEQKEAEARELIGRLDSGGGVLLLTDMFGATPSNIARRLYQPGRVDGLTGVNVPMLLRAAYHSDKTLEEVIRVAADCGRNCILPVNADSGSCDC